MVEVNFKVILKRPDNTQEARRFVMNDIFPINLVTLNQKLLELFPELVGKQYRIFWKDLEDDEVVVKSDRELVIALLSLQDVKKIYVDFKENGQKMAEKTPRDGIGEVHRGIKCDECEETIVGIRFKCLQCPDYDLCEKCELKNLHPNHIMMKIPNELPQHLGSCWSRIYSSVDHMAKAVESARYSGRDHCKRCDRKCRGKYRRSCYCNGKDIDGGTRETEDKQEDNKNEQQSKTIPVELLLSPSLLRRNCGRESNHDWHIPREIENAVCSTVKFFVEAVRDGFTPKTRSEMGKGEGSEQNVTSKPKNDDETVKKDEKENEMLEVFTRKLSDGHVSEKSSEASGKMEDVENKPESVNTGKIYPSVPVDPKIEEALQGMLAMGFSTKGGTLQKLLEEMDGDIAQVLECIDSSLM